MSDRELIAMLVKSVMLMEALKQRDSGLIEEVKRRASEQGLDYKEFIKLNM